MESSCAASEITTLLGLNIPTVGTKPFPVFWSSLHFSHLVDLYFPEHLYSLVSYLPCCFIPHQASCLGFLTSNNPHCAHRKEGRYFVLQQKMERQRQWETQVELKIACTVLYTAQEKPD